MRVAKVKVAELGLQDPLPHRQLQAERWKLYLNVTILIDCHDSANHTNTKLDVTILRIRMAIGPDTDTITGHGTRASIPSRSGSGQRVGKVPLHAKAGMQLIPLKLLLKLNTDLNSI